MVTGRMCRYADFKCANGAYVHDSGYLTNCIIIYAVALLISVA